MRRHILRLFAASGASRGLAHLQRHRAVVLMYHGFRSDPASDGAWDDYGSKVSADAFAAQVKYLAQHHQVVPLATLVESLRDGVPLPERCVVLTIDDGYRSVFDVAYPILRDASMPASLFVVADFLERGTPLWPDRVHHAVMHGAAGSYEVDLGVTLMTVELGDEASRARASASLIPALKAVPWDVLTRALAALEHAAGARADASNTHPSAQPLSWAQAREMSDSGLVDIGSHTVHHPILTRCSHDVMRQELFEARAHIEARLGRPCPHFCYPNGAAGDFDALTTSLVVAAGHTCALTTVPGFVDRGDDPFRIRRFAVSGHDSVEAFALTFALGRSLQPRLKARLEALA